MSEQKRVVTYSKKKFAKAKTAGCAIEVCEDKTVQARKHHRSDLRSWIAETAIDGDVVTDPRNIVPFRAKCYGAIVKSLLSLLPAEAETLQGELSAKKNGSAIKKWRGDRQDFDGVLATDWISSVELFKIACGLDEDLEETLRNRKSGRKDVKHSVSDPLQKFTNNIGTLQRSPKNGWNDYSKPLAQCLFAIDSRWETIDGESEIFFRLVVGRSEPQKMKKPRKQRVVSEPEPVESIEPEVGDEFSESEPDLEAAAELAMENDLESGVIGENEVV